MNDILFFDIETEANEEALKFIPEPTAPGNYKDEEKIASYITEKKAEQVEKAALDADYGKIIAIGVQFNDTRDAVLLGDDGYNTEKDLIGSFWSLFYEARGMCCGYNIIGFDLPYLMRRSFDLGIKIQSQPVLAKYRTNPTLDLMGVLYNWGTAKSLKFVAERYGIPNPLPELDGSQVAGMDSDTLRKYVMNDVDMVVALYNKMRGIYFA